MGTIDERAGLRQVESGKWEKIFWSYLVKIRCPLAVNSPPPTLISWMLGLAVRLEYGESKEKFNQNGVDNVQEDSMDSENEQFIAGVDALASKLQIPWHPDPNIRLTAVSNFISTRLNKEVLAKPGTVIPQGNRFQPFPFREQDSGLEDGKDEAVAESAKILRLLYIHDLRKLQTSINECIVSIQKVTANPKTDTRLGKVGR